MEQLNGKGFILNYFFYSPLIIKEPHTLPAKQQEQNEADVFFQALLDTKG